MLDKIKQCYSFFNTKLKKRDLYKELGANLKCPHCNTWSHDVNGFNFEETESHDIVNCKKCNKESSWDLGSPVPILLGV